MFVVLHTFAEKPPIDGFARNLAQGGRGFVKEILELHKRWVWGTEVPQRGPGAEPR